MDLKITNENKHIQNTTAEQISTRYTEAEKLKIAEASKGFESLLSSMMLKSMTQTTGGMFGEDSYGGDYFGSIFETEIADKMSEGKGLGVAEVLFRKLTGEDIDEYVKLAKRRIETTSEKIGLTNIEGVTISPSSSSIDRVGKFEDIIKEASEMYGVDVNLIKSVILTESAGNERALSKVKAKGLMQLMDGTARDLGVKNSWDPKENIMGGTKYLAGLLRQYNGNVKLALAGYNAGPGNVEKYNGIPPFEETKNYITRVTGYLNHLNSL